MIVYVVMMCRWGDNEQRSYVSSVHTTLREALIEGLNHYAIRGHKYEPWIYAVNIGDVSGSTIVCDDIGHTRKLLYDMDNPE